MKPWTSERLSPDQIALTNKYLNEVGLRYATPLLAMQVLFGKCCLASLYAPSSVWDDLAEELSQLAAGILAHPDPARLNLDPLPIAEIDRMMRQQGKDIHALRKILERVGPELEALSDEVRSSGRVRLISSALAGLGFACRVFTPAKEVTRLIAEREIWFRASAAQLLDLTDHLLANGQAIDETDTKLLALIALGELRKYRIDVGCKLLRTALQLGLPCEETQDGVDFIALQRRRDGRYGFSDCFEEKPEPAPDPDLKLFLPVTLNAVWLFAIEAACSANEPVLVPSGGCA